jgi:SSS family transporter
MSAIDWAVLAATVLLIVGYGAWKTRGKQTAESYLRGGHETKWHTIGLSIMATQASAITFLSMPGQAYEDGLGFVQFYFGLPVAVVILCATIVPLYYRLKVYTAYEYLESRFDLKTRLLTAFLFMLGRGLAAGLSIYAPSIILSTMLGWPLTATTLAIGVAVILYTVSGGTRAVSYTQTGQMAVMLGGMALAAVFVVLRLPADVSLRDALGIAGALGKMNVVDLSARFDTRYTLWSGLGGGMFVALAYFGTDQSQVQRYLSGASLAESRLGLLFNGLVKVPMQFLILFVGVLVFAFYQFQRPPLIFNQAEVTRVQTRHGPEWASLEGSYAQARDAKQRGVEAWLASGGSAAAKEELRQADAAERDVREGAKKLVASTHPRGQPNDSDYIFISFIVKHFPAGLVGLLIAVIFCAAMSATASALNALSTTTAIDFYKRLYKPQGTEAELLFAAKGFTVFWGAAAVAFAVFASQLDNLIQAVNILGSIFYGPMLGVFLVGFFVKGVKGTAAFWATVVAQGVVVAVFAASSIGYLWYNVIGCAVVLLLAPALSLRRALI